MASRPPHAPREMEGEGVLQAPDLEVRRGDQPMTRGLRGSTGHPDLRKGTSRAVTALLPSHGTYCASLLLGRADARRRRRERSTAARSEGYGRADLCRAGASWQTPHRSRSGYRIARHKRLADAHALDRYEAKGASPQTYSSKTPDGTSCEASAGSRHRHVTQAGGPDNNTSGADRAETRSAPHRRCRPCRKRSARTLARADLIQTQASTFLRGPRRFFSACGTSAASSSGGGADTVSSGALLATPFRRC